MMHDLALYLVTDPSARLGVIETARAAARAGVRWVQLRDKDASEEALEATARALKAALDPLGARLLINDHPEIAARVGAAGVHVGQGDAPVVRARALLGPDAIVGLSVNTAAQMAQVDWDLVDYVGVGPVFATATKSDHEAPLGMPGVATLCAGARAPAVAIGGLRAEHAAQLRQAGAAGMAVVSAICGAEDPGVACSEILNQWGAA